MAPPLRTLRALLGPLALITAGLQILSFDRLDERPFLGFSESAGSVRTVNDGGPAHGAGLEPGDRILSVDGVEVRFHATASHLLAQDTGGGRLLAVQRGAERLELTLRPVQPSPSEVMWRMAIAAVALGTLLTGLMVHVRKHRPVTLAFFGICYGLGFLLFPPEVPATQGMLLVRSVALDLVSALLPALFVHFFLLFPARRSVLDRTPVLSSVLYIPSIAIFAAVEGVHVAQAVLEMPVWDVLAALEGAVFALFVAGVLFSLVLFARAYRNMNVPTLRRRFHVTFLGTLIGITPTLVVFLLHNLFPHRTIPGDRLAVVTLIFIPASFGYAIIRHGVFEIDRLVRRSLAVTLMTGALLLVYFAVYFVMRGSLDSATGAHGVMLSVLALSFVLLLFSPVRRWLQAVFDSDPVVSPPDGDRTVWDFGRKLRSVLDWGELVQELVDGLVQRLGSRSALFFSADPGGNGLTLAYACGIRLGLLGQARLGGGVLRAVERLGEPILREDLDAELPFGWLEDGDRQGLERIGAQVLAPVKGKDRPLGLLVLGPADAGGYESWQMEFLDDLLDQGAMALENAEYHRNALRESRFRYDLQVAKSLQRQLLPRRSPPLPNLELAGQTISCQDVGGDYYDFLLPNPGHLVLCVGDVSGKGVPGALLMANLQAIFRAEAPQSWAEPDRLLERLNPRICEIRRPDRFISFFCATLDLQTRRLRYASAGHPPPFLMRRDGALEELDLSGLPLGIRAETTYSAGEARLFPGDVLLSYSDGAIEREGPRGVMGQEGLARVLARHRHLSARDLLQRVMAEIRYFSTNELEDDTTLLVLKAL